MIYSEYEVNRLYAPFIKKLWTLDHLAGLETVGKSVLPNGCFTIAFVGGNGILAKTCRQHTFLPAGIYFCGQLTSAIKVDMAPQTKAVMVQLYAWAPAYFTDMDMYKLRDRIIPMNDGFFKADQVPGEQKILYGLYGHFKKHLSAGPHATLLTESCLRLLESQGNRNMMEICRDLGCSDRHLQKVFRRYTGLSPKEFSLILKLRNAVDDLAYPPDIRLSVTQLALKHHFYDQSHFNHAFKSVVDLPPGKFRPADYLLAFKK